MGNLSNTAIAGIIAIVSTTLQFACMSQFTPLIDEAAFEEPGPFTLKFGEFVDDFEAAMYNAVDLSAYITLMYWDWAFAIFGGISKMSLLYLLTSQAKWPWYTVPVHVFLDVLENFIVFIALNQFENDASVNGMVGMLPIVSSIKWASAGLNTGSIPVLAIYRLIMLFVKEKED